MVYIWIMCALAQNQNEEGENSKLQLFATNGRRSQTAGDAGSVMLKNMAALIVSQTTRSPLPRLLPDYTGTTVNHLNRVCVCACVKILYVLYFLSDLERCTSLLLTVVISTVHKTYTLGHKINIEPESLSLLT